MVRYLNTEAKIEMLKSEFHPFYIINIDCDSIGENEPSGSVNLTINIDEVKDKQWKDFYYHIKDYISYVEEDGKKILTFENLLFTDGDNISNLYSYEYYKGILYIKMTSYTKKVAMHIIPKSYYSMDKVLIFKDSDVQDMSKHFSCTDEFYSRHDNNRINLYYQKIDLDKQQKGDRSRQDRCPNFGLYDKTNPQSLFQKIQDGNWVKENYRDMYGEYIFDISTQTKNMRNLQINTGYYYNDASPYNAIHYTGVQDDTNNAVEDKCVLLDTNFDDIRDDNYTNVIKQMEYIKESNSMSWPKTNNIMENKGFINSHSQDKDIGNLNHKTIKYFNDDLYVEEKNKYIEASWVDQKL